MLHKKAHHEGIKAKQREGQLWHSASRLLAACLIQFSVQRKKKKVIAC
jgi:hypothetical protein